MGFIEFFINILSTPAVLVGLFAMIGLILQAKPAEEILKGTFKTIVGFLVLSAGAGYLTGGTGPLTNFGVLFNATFSVSGSTPNNEAVVAIALGQVASTTAYIMIIGMIANIVLARLSSMKYIFLTGHHTLYMACLLAVVLNVAGLAPWQTVIAGGLVLGLVMVLAPALAAPVMKKITGGEEVVLGHFGTFGYWVSAQVGKFFAGKDPQNKPKSTEEINFPQRLAFLRDTTVAIAITMVFFFLVISVIGAVKGVFSEGGDLYGLLAGEGGLRASWIVWAIVQGLSFAAGVFVILAGIRLIIGEIVPAFRGIGEKLVPQAKPALDCPITFPYAPNAVLIGFLSSFVGGIIGLGIIFAINGGAGGQVLAVILPGVIPHFFCGATAGVFGNATGGTKGCVFGAFIQGIVITFLPAFLYLVLGQIVGQGTTFGDADFAIVGLVLGGISLKVKTWGLFIICIILYLLPIILSPLFNKGKKA
ncbi:MAG: PTS ascorbate transporter subunit IIC [Spirochaetaceae bacterium]|jgi:PTS system ascorbate-specific IIC component|nr:PTS ascorbate transporter subunit IIC [Spirochaetaceae bacterium]